VSNSIIPSSLPPVLSEEQEVQSKIAMMKVRYLDINLKIVKMVEG
jgi:hypothetical protein